MNRCVALLIALVSILILAPSAAGATDGHLPRASVHVRHQTIHHPARKGHKHRRSHHKHRRHKHKHHARRTHKRAVQPLSHQRPATASRDCPGANLMPRTENIASVVSATLCLVNDERARFGAPALTEDAHLSNAATSHSRDMDARHYFEHVGPGGQTLLTRIEASGFIPNGHVGYTLGENIAWGTLWLGTPRAIVRAWMASPGHRANILNPSFRDTGIGIDPALPRSMSGGQAGGMYTQDFGAING